MRQQLTPGARLADLFQSGASKPKTLIEVQRALGGSAANVTLTQLRAEIMARAAYTLVAEAGAQQQRQSTATAGSSAV